ncbi:unnamed protein product, partial [Brassica rapa subsp. trilocularis]
EECEEEESYRESAEPAHSVPLRRLCRLTVALSQNASSPIGDLRRFLRRSLPLCFLLQDLLVVCGSMKAIQIFNGLQHGISDVGLGSFDHVQSLKD